MNEWIEHYFGESTNLGNLTGIKYYGVQGVSPATPHWASYSVDAIIHNFYEVVMYG